MNMMEDLARSVKLLALWTIRKDYPVLVKCYNDSIITYEQLLDMYNEFENDKVKKVLGVE